MDKIFKNMQYIEMMPKVKAEKYPLIINIHGAGGRGNSLDGIRNSAVEQFQAAHDNFPAIVICPLCFANTWFDIFEQLKEFVLHHTVIVVPIGVVGDLVAIARECPLRIVVECHHNECPAARYKLCRIKAQVAVAFHVAHVGMIVHVDPSIQFFGHFIAHRIGLGKTASRESQA